MEISLVLLCCEPKEIRSSCLLIRVGVWVHSLESGCGGAVGGGAGEKAAHRCP